MELMEQVGPGRSRLQEGLPTEREGPEGWEGLPAGAGSPPPFSYRQLFEYALWSSGEVKENE